MVDQNKAVIIPPPPRPPVDGVWTVDYGNQLNRWLENISRYLTGPFYLRGTGLFFPEGALPTSGYGLRAGEVFSNDGVLTMVRPDDIWAGGFAISAELGTLTVTV
jgi:hypothetical protein